MTADVGTIYRKGRGARAPLDLNRLLGRRVEAASLRLPAGALPSAVREAYRHAQAGRRERALACLKEAVPDGYGSEDSALVALVLGLTYERLERLESAARWYERCVSVQAHPAVYASLAGVYERRLRYGRALAAWEQAERLDSAWALSDDRRAYLTALSGRLPEAVAALRERAERGALSAAAESFLLWYLPYLDTTEPATLRSRAEAWARRHAPRSDAPQHRISDWNPRRRLRIGYLSADLCRHSVTTNLAALWTARDPAATEIVAYSNVARPDAVTDRLRGVFDAFHDVATWRDETLAERIVDDRIDLLVTVGGHTPGHRLTALAGRPAPLIVDYGAIATLGLSQVGYRLTDARLDPADAEPEYAERLCRVPGGLFCFTPPDEAPDVTEGPGRDSAHVTFGCFNNHLKISPRVQGLWIRILQALPQARLLLKFPGSHDAAQAARVRTGFDRAGVAERVGILDYAVTPAEHLRAYAQVDVALDTAPFNGCVTTFEALWMGVPVVSLRGRTHVGRVGTAILEPLGLGRLAAWNETAYVEAACALARQPAVRAQLRRSLRTRLATSGHCDTERFAREVTAIYRRLWGEACAEARG